MAGYEEFLSFDWSDERWRIYLNGLYPPPKACSVYRKLSMLALGACAQEQIAKFKKKWYKKNIDATFDDSYEAPPPPPSEPPPSGLQPNETWLRDEHGPLPKSIYHDGSRWGTIGGRALGQAKPLGDMAWDGNWGHSHSDRTDSCHLLSSSNSSFLILFHPFSSFLLFSFHQSPSFFHIVTSPGLWRPKSHHLLRSIFHCPCDCDRQLGRRTIRGTLMAVFLAIRFLCFRG
eukprot:Skav226043  [mRNA]  locus=scaffold211:35634:36772:+ [translate_table: standard]